jgi:hypothetical protein
MADGFGLYFPIVDDSLAESDSGYCQAGGIAHASGAPPLCRCARLIIFPRVHAIPVDAIG